MFERITERLERNDRAVSPVIGVILMVAITVILAAVIGTFVLDLGSNVGQSAPQASMGIADHSDDFEATGGVDAFRVNHDGGADIPLDQVRIQVRNADTNALVDEYDSGFTDLNLSLNGASAASTDIVSTGDQLVIEDGGTSVLTDNTQYRITFIDKDAGEQIAAATVTLR